MTRLEERNIVFERAVGVQIGRLHAAVGSEFSERSREDSSKLGHASEQAGIVSIVDDSFQ